VDGGGTENPSLSLSRCLSLSVSPWKAEVVVVEMEVHVELGEEGSSAWVWVCEFVIEW
jgi:hypothetical protein